MQKITNLFRLNSLNKSLIIKYLLKRVLRKSVTVKEKTLNDYYFHLIKSNGVLMYELENAFVSFYPKLNLKLCLRKRPSSDVEVFSQIFHNNEYLSVVESFKKKFPSKKSITLLDAGSNIGLTTIYFNKYFPNSKFIAVEPSKENFEVMSKNFELNEVNTVDNVNAGIWKNNCYLKLVKDFRDKNDWSIRVEESSLKTDLKAYSIDYLLQKNSVEIIDILKIDIEGSEKEIFSNESIYKSFLEKTRCIAIEIHDEFNCREDIYSILKKFNFEFYNSGELTIGINTNL